MKKFFSDYAFIFRFLAAIPIAAGFVALFYWEVSISQKKARVALARCEEWESKGGSFLWKHGPFNKDYEPWGSGDEDFMMPLRNCRVDLGERVVFGDEYTQEFIDSQCHSGARYVPNMISFEDMMAAKCFQGMSTKNVKIFSWKTNLKDF